MPIYLVERDLEGISLDGLGDAKEAANDQARRMRVAGTQIHYLRSTFVPQDGRCMCLFEAETEAVVRALNEEAGLPYFRIVPAYDLDPVTIRGTEPANG
ncbi:DUF4242 domain-containing protein [soil metagenome]